MAKLNERQKMWVEEYLANGYNGAAAYRKIYGNNGARPDKLAWDLKSKPHVQAEIQRRLQEINGPKEEIIEKLARKLLDVALADKESETVALANQLKAIDLLSKQLGIQTSNSNVKVEQVIFEGESSLED